MHKKKSTPKRVTVRVPPLTPPLVVPVSETGMIDTAGILHVLAEVRLEQDKDKKEDEEKTEEDGGPTPATSSDPIAGRVHSPAQQPPSQTPQVVRRLFL